MIIAKHLEIALIEYRMTYPGAQEVVVTTSLGYYIGIIITILGKKISGGLNKSSYFFLILEWLILSYHGIFMVCSAQRFVILSAWIIFRYLF